MRSCASSLYAEHAEHFRNMVEPRLRQLGHKQCAAIFVGLQAAINRFNLNQTEARRSRRVATFLREMEQFRALVAEAQPGSKMALHPESLAALGGRYPAPAAFDHAVQRADDLATAGREQDELPVWGSERNQIRSTQNLFAHAAGRDRPTFVIRQSAQRIREDVWASLNIDTSSEKAILFTVPDWLFEEPSEIRDRFIRLIDIRIAEIRKAIQLREGFNAGPRTLHSFAEESAEWALMRDVLDAIWPLERGKPNSRQIGALKAIIDETTSLAAGYPEESDPSDGQSLKWAGRESGPAPHIGSDRKSAIITYRHQLTTLRAAIAVVERNLQKAKVGGIAGKAVRDRTRKSYLSLHGLRDWRREVERRLEAGDYLIHHTEAPRPSGPLLWLPAFPKSKPDVNDPVFLAALCKAALQVGKPPARPCESDRRPRRR